MVELHDVSLLLAAKPQELVLLGDVNAVLAPGELVAVVGPPHSGKSMLLKVLAGIRHPTFGEVVWTQANVDPVHARPEIAYLPQDSHAACRERNLATVEEQVHTALRLRVAGMKEETRRERTAALLEKTGLAPLAKRRLDALTPAQWRRVDLATELAGAPALVLCDESAAASDPKTERDLTQLLRTLAREESLTIVQVTHALESLESYDSVLVLHGGQLAYQGPPEFLTHYFQLEAAADLYEKLATRRPDDWHRSWTKHGKAYLSAEGRKQLASELSEENRRGFLEKHRESSGRVIHLEAPSRASGGFSQFLTLLLRRWRLAWRNLPALGVHLALLFAFPCAVALLATGDLLHLQELSEELKGNVTEQLKENAVFAVKASRGVGLVAGLALAQALLLAFMAAHNGAREIAGERMTFEREKYRGLHPGAYVASKAAFLLPWVLMQSAWMGWYVQNVCRLPGNLWMQIAVLTLLNAALTSLCLAVSSLTRAAWRALPACLCLAALQLPLSSTVLSPPETLSWLIRPLGTLYWAASAYLQSMQGTRFYEALQIVTPLPLSPMILCIAILTSHLILGLVWTISGCKIARLGVARKPFGI